MRTIFVGTCCLLTILAVARGDDAPKKFRTDADGHYKPDEVKKLAGKQKDEVLPWYQVVPGQFPPEGSAHAVSGELIWVDHLERRFHLRVDRNDGQDRGVWDLAINGVMLPYGSIYYHGAPAAMEDIPLGTHLHGLFYIRAPDDKTPPPEAQNNRVTPEADFRRCFQLKDDFTYYADRHELWKIESVDRTAMKLTAVSLVDGKPFGTPKQFDLLSSTRVFAENGFAPLSALAPGQTVLFNLTWATLYGPGRLTDVWIDDAARRLATEQQMERHRNHIRQRGLAGWVTEVDDDKEIVKVVFFGGIDSALLKEIPLDPAPSPTATAATPPTPSKPGLAVARDSLMTYDPVNDRKRGEILNLRQIAVEPGSSGLEITLKMEMLLEGYRPTRIVRLYPATWPVIALPREEQFFGRE